MGHETIPGSPTEDVKLEDYEREGIAKCLDFLKKHSALDMAHELKNTLDKYFDAGESGEEMDDLSWRYGLYEDPARKELLKQIEAYIDTHETQPRESAVNEVMMNVGEYNKNDFLNWIEDPKSLKRDDPDLYETMEENYGRRLDHVARAMLLKRLK